MWDSPEKKQSRLPRFRNTESADYCVFSTFVNIVAWTLQLLWSLSLPSFLARCVVSSCIFVTQTVNVLRRLYAQSILSMCRSAETVIIWKRYCITWTNSKTQDQSAHVNNYNFANYRLILEIIFANARHAVFWMQRPYACAGWSADFEKKLFIRTDHRSVNSFLNVPGQIWLVHFRADSIFLLHPKWNCRTKDITTVIALKFHYDVLDSLDQTARTGFFPVRTYSQWTQDIWVRKIEDSNKRS